MRSSGIRSARAFCTTSTRSVWLSGLSIHSEPRQVGMRQLSAVHYHAAEFGAAVQHRENLAGIEQALVIESAFEPLLLVEIGFGKHLRHQIALLDAHPMLAGKDAAHLHAQLQDVGTEFLGAREL